MLTVVLAHPGQPAVPHDLWTAWDADPLVAVALLLGGWAYARGRTRHPGRRGRWRALAFPLALGALAVALLSPLDAVAGALASAHMVQHVLLVLVVAPLLAFSAPSSALLRGAPPPLRRALLRSRRRLGLRWRTPGGLRRPVPVWLLHVAVLWGWHAAAPYEASLAHPLVHALEHASFLATGVAFWSLVVGGRTGLRVAPGLGVMLVFATALQGVALSLLLTFARAPWYEPYTATTGAWGLDALTDQRLAGVIMWVPGGFVYPAVALTLLVAWVRASEDGLGCQAEGPVVDASGAR